MNDAKRQNLMAAAAFGLLLAVYAAVAAPFPSVLTTPDGRLASPTNTAFFGTNLWATNVVAPGTSYGVSHAPIVLPLVPGQLYYFQSSATDQGSLYTNGGTLVIGWPTNGTFVADGGVTTVGTGNSASTVSSQVYGPAWTNYGLFSGDLYGNFHGDVSAGTNARANVGSFAALAAHDSTTNFWLDFSGQTYQKVVASGDVCFTIPTNGPGALSVKIRPNGANRNVLWPTNFVTLNTNGLTVNGTNYQLVLTNGARVAYCSFVADANNPDDTNVVAMVVTSP